MRASLLLDIDFARAGNSGTSILDGWAEPELRHRRTLGRQSRLRLPMDDCSAEGFLVINATP